MLFLCKKSGLHAVVIKYENSAVRYDIFITRWRLSELTNYRRYLKTENIDNIKWGWCYFDVIDATIIMLYI